MAKMNMEQVERVPVVIDGWENQVDFDIYRINTRQMQDFLSAANTGNFANAAKVFKHIIVSMPSEWGDPKNEDDLLELVPFVNYKRMIKLVIEKFEDDSKN